VEAKEKVVYKRFSQKRGVKKKKKKEPPQRSVLITMEVMCSCKNMVRRRRRRRRAMPMTCMEIVVCFLFLVACFLLANMLAYGDVGSHRFNNLCGHD
jgi:hypothetical protein